MRLLFYIFIIIYSVNCYDVAILKNEYMIPNFKINFDHLSDTCKAQYASVTESGTIIDMIDASTKIPSGIITGNIADYGNFDQCISIEHKMANDELVLGQYCGRSLIVILPQDMETFTTLSLSICIPSGCQLSELVKGLNISLVQGVDMLCQTKETGKEWDWGDITVASVLGVIAYMIVISTCYDIFLHQFNKDTAHPICTTFSVLTNGKKLFAVHENLPNQLNCLNGIRFFSMLWVIMGHRFVSTQAIPTMNSYDVHDWQYHKLYSFYLQSARAAVDTFFFLSGLLGAYGYFKSLRKNPMTIKSIPVYYIHRLLRITPALAALYFIQITILRHLASGPLWPLIFKMTRDTCTKYWWTFFLYIQNYVNHTDNDMCIVPTWYLSADMQMFAISPLIILPLGYLTLKYNSKIAYIWSLTMVIIAMIVPMIIDLFRENDNEYDTHTRLSSWLLGIFTGMFMYEVQNTKQRKINTLLNFCIWIIALAGMITILMCLPNVRNYPTFLKTNLFFTFSRPAWCICIGWIVYSCTTGSGGIVNWILSRPIYQVVVRLSYSMYLLHNPIITISLATARSTIYFNDYNILYYWCGDVVFTTLISVVWVLAFESPMIGIEKIIFGKSKPKQPEIKQGVDNGSYIKDIA